MYLAIYKSAGSQASRLGIALALIRFSVYYVVSTAFVSELTDQHCPLPSIALISRAVYSW